MNVVRNKSRDRNSFTLPDILCRSILLFFFQMCRRLQTEATAKLMTAFHHLCREISGDKNSCVWKMELLFLNCIKIISINILILILIQNKKYAL